MNDLQKRGYLVKETGAVYYSMDMDKTLAWFTDVLGWYGQIDARDENNVGMYGCVNNIPIEFESLGLAPFAGIHMFHGETEKRMVGFMKVEGVEEKLCANGECKEYCEDEHSNYRSIDIFGSNNIVLLNIMWTTIRRVDNGWEI